MQCCHLRRTSVFLIIHSVLGVSLDRCAAELPQRWPRALPPAPDSTIIDEEVLRRTHAHPSRTAGAKTKPLSISEQGGSVAGEGPGRCRSNAPRGIRRAARGGGEGGARVQCRGICSPPPAQTLGMKVLFFFQPIRRFQQPTSRDGSKSRVASMYLFWNCVHA